ncbi:MATE family efflux transporter [Erythrobacter rubeus]|uniref:Multidrug-efflux transporter n=1 Tax=Erythrobacter rubeus TaxID=2760803 RepID=A0ABR8KV46_9SPHN|nr:MATE family efflux transporter [Erythrobacter rubeus]MBD2843465.1 MATE family efflux transporter [Erythrobacter rubeus]
MQEQELLETPGWGQELRATTLLAAPLALANLLQASIYIIDVIFIARLGEEPLAASGLAAGLFGLIVWTMASLVGAVAPLIAEAIGSRSPSFRPVRRATRMALWLAVMSGVCGMGAALLLGPAMRLTGQQPEIITLASEYNFVIIYSLIPMLLAAVLRNYVSALGRPVVATAITALGIPVNAIANYAFIFGNFGAPELGLTGAAVATIITAIITLSAYIAVILLNPALARYRIFYRFWRPDWQRFWTIARIGAPIALTVTAEAGVFSAAAFLMGRIGAAQLAGHIVALNIAALAFQVPFGVGQAATIRVGYFYGAQDNEGIKLAGWVALAIGAGFMAFTAMAMILVPEQLLRIFVDIGDPENAALVGFALQFLVLAAAFQLVDGVQAVAAGALRGLQDTRVPMWIAIFSYWVPGFGLAFGLGFFTPLEGTGVWIGLATGLAFAAALLTWRWMLRERLQLTLRCI